MYYLQSRYYDPVISRFLTADKLSTLHASSYSVTDTNLFAYCDNNPVMRKDDGGMFWETVFDVISLASSVAEVVINPVDPWAWASLVGDVVDLVPFVTGVGEITKTVKLTVSVLDKVDDSADVVKTARRILNSADESNMIRKATGSYEIIYDSGKNYVGKGGFDRAIKSAKQHTLDKNGNVIDKVREIRWESAADDRSAFIAEYLKQKNGRGVLSSNPMANTYNKIWSPGRKYYGDI